MNAKEYLKSAANIDIEIQIKKDEINRLKTSYVDALLHAKHIQKLEKEVAALTDKKVAVSLLLGCLSDPIGSEILRQRYLLGRPWKQIAKQMGGMSVRNAFYIRDKSLVEFEKLLDEYNNAMANPPSEEEAKE